jgi:hypothetical protein
VSLSVERAKRIRVACSEASRCAMAAPMPIEAPVISTVWPARDMVGIYGVVDSRKEIVGSISWYVQEPIMCRLEPRLVLCEIYYIIMMSQ